MREERKKSWCDRVGIWQCSSPSSHPSHLFLNVLRSQNTSLTVKRRRIGKIPMPRQMLLLREADATSHGQKDKESTRKRSPGALLALLRYLPLAPSLPPRRICWKGKGEAKEGAKKERTTWSRSRKNAQKVVQSRSDRVLVLRRKVTRSDVSG